MGSMPENFFPCFQDGALLLHSFGGAKGLYSHGIKDRNIKGDLITPSGSFYNVSGPLRGENFHG